MARIWATTSRSRPNGVKVGASSSPRRRRTFDGVDVARRGVEGGAFRFGPRYEFEGCTKEEGAGLRRRAASLETRRCGGGEGTAAAAAATNTSGARHETALRGRRALSETDGCRATGQGPLTLEFGGLRVTVERSDGVSTIAGGRVERRHASVRSPRRRKARQPLHVTGNSTGSPVRRSTAPVKPPPSPRREAPAVLPSGWSQVVPARASSYYLDHATKTTTGSTRPSCGRRPCARRWTFSSFYDDVPASPDARTRRCPARVFCRVRAAPGLLKSGA